MEISRRSFLGGVLALTAATALPSAVFAEVPTIHGDGIHDDAPGLQALFDGKPFRVDGQAPMMLDRIRGEVRINGGRFLISRPLRITKRAWITNSAILASDGYAGKELITFDASESPDCIRLYNCTFASMAASKKRLYGAGVFHGRFSGFLTNTR